MVELVVRSESLHAWDAVSVTGDHPHFGPWHAAGRRLEWIDGAFRTRLELPRGTRLNYLFVRGNWRHVEHAENGLESRPHELIVEPGLRIEHEIAGWGRDAVRYHPDVPSKYLPHPRTIAVHLPPGYDLHPLQRYPVVYLHDGQNLFDRHTAFAGVTWNCDDTADRLARSGEIRPVIQVGLGNTPDRLNEYGPTREGDDLAEAYARAIIAEIKPMIDREYRTRPGPRSTGVAGSSMGGLISLHLARQHPSVFGLCAALSPSLWWDDAAILHDCLRDPRGLRTAALWIDMGGHEGFSDSGRRANLDRTRALFEAARTWPEGRCHYLEVPEGLHNESAWAARYPDVLRFLLPSSRMVERRSEGLSA